MDSNNLAKKLYAPAFGPRWQTRGTERVGVCKRAAVRISYCTFRREKFKGGQSELVFHTLLQLNVGKTGNFDSLVDRGVFRDLKFPWPCLSIAFRL